MTPADQIAIDGAALLSDVQSFIRRFCAFPDEHHSTAVTLWVAHAHVVEYLYTSPRLAVLSPEKNSGKTRVLEVVSLLVPGVMMSLSASPAAVFRRLQKQQITLLLDEVDTIFSTRGKDDNHEDLRALLNAGYKRGAMIPRCVGPTHEVVDFPVFAAVALAGIGDCVPDTTMSRSIVIRMRRRAPTEIVEPYRHRIHEPVGHALRDRLAAWGAQVGKHVGALYPSLPDGVVDRAAECWEPLVALADAAGGHWPDSARRACISLLSAATEDRVSLGERLLGDIRTIFRDAIALHTETILDRLHHGQQYGLDDDAPWNDLRGQPLSVRGLAKMLRSYGVRSTKVKVGGASLQGYRREHLWDAWQRYLPSPVSASPELMEPLAPSAGISAGYDTEHGSGNGSSDSESRQHSEPAESSNGASSYAGSGSSGLAAPGECQRCDGEGCAWCETPSAPPAQLHRRRRG